MTKTKESRHSVANPQQIHVVKTSVKGACSNDSATIVKHGIKSSLNKMA